MYFIQLNSLQFRSFHGVHEEERILGNDYEVNIKIGFETEGKVTDIAQTIDYGVIFAVVSNRMKIPARLLETVAGDLAEEIHQLDTRIKNVSINIIKKYPPLEGISGSAGVTCSNEY